MNPLISQLMQALSFQGGRMSPRPDDPLAFLASITPADLIDPSQDLAPNGEPWRYEPQKKPMLDDLQRALDGQPTFRVMDGPDRSTVVSPIQRAMARQQAIAMPTQPQQSAGNMEGWKGRLYGMQGPLNQHELLKMQGELDGIVQANPDAAKEAAFWKNNLNTLIRRSELPYAKSQAAQQAGPPQGSIGVGGAEPDSYERWKNDLDAMGQRPMQLGPMRQMQQRLMKLPDGPDKERWIENMDVLIPRGEAALAPGSPQSNAVADGPSPSDVAASAIEKIVSELRSRNAIGPAPQQTPFGPEDRTNLNRLADGTRVSPLVDRAISGKSVQPSREKAAYEFATARPAGGSSLEAALTKAMAQLPEGERIDQMYPDSRGKSTAVKGASGTTNQLVRTADGKSVLMSPRAYTAYKEALSGGDEKLALRAAQASANDQQANNLKSRRQDEMVRTKGLSALAAKPDLAEGADMGRMNGIAASRAARLGEAAANVQARQDQANPLLAMLRNNGSDSPIAQQLLLQQMGLSPRDAAAVAADNFKAKSLTQSAEEDRKVQREGLAQRGQQAADELKLREGAMTAEQRNAENKLSLDQQDLALRTKTAEENRRVKEQEDKDRLRLAEQLRARDDIDGETNPKIRTRKQLEYNKKFLSSEPQETSSTVPMSPAQKRDLEYMQGESDPNKLSQMVREYKDRYGEGSIPAKTSGGGSEKRGRESEQERWLRLHDSLGDRAEALLGPFDAPHSPSKIIASIAAEEAAGNGLTPEQIKILEEGYKYAPGKKAGEGRFSKELAGQRMKNAAGKAVRESVMGTLLPARTIYNPLMDALTRALYK